MLKINNRVLLIYIAFLIELLSLSICKRFLPALINPFVTISASLFIVWYAYKYWQTPNDEEIHSITGKKKQWLKIGSSVLAIFTMVYFVFFFASEPIDINKSDIIPIIQQFYVERLFNGEFVYSAVNRGTYFWTPNYFPMHWLPFCVSYFFHFDHRIMALFVLLLALVYYSFKVINQSENSFSAIVKIVMPYLILLCMRFDERIILGHTVETLICAYYLLFAVNIINGKTGLKSIGLSSVLLSRFSIVLWTPFYIISLFITNKRETIKLCIYCFVFALVVFIVPFLIKDPFLLVNGFSAFTDVYLMEWKGQSWQQPGDNPYQLFNGLGLACYYYSFWPGELINKLNALVATQMTLNILTPIICFLLMKKFKNKIGMEKYQLLTLKICLLLFYSFIVVPYQYLFMVPLFISVVIINQFDLIKRT